MSSTVMVASGIFSAVGDIEKQASYVGVGFILAAVAYVAMRELFKRGVGAAIAAALGCIAVAVIAGNAYGIYNSGGQELHQHGVQSGTCGPYCR
ncbi:hypothetical protein P0W64_16445 [Tsukamurella sp. 8F]|uniref:hypothetical protein n=1 Tax=unclassified Tsukamurella TaxID=2633480 RepID=UPI0023B93DAA|nr:MULTISPECIES: hypothetical protein [unclassified Tsukamurella]MDF0531125.1 hypothetical protein [Tsukamurella sp. 8J]MDF0588371.1 hypothetical protein [Tsukamurella sp. 8F]